LTPVVLIHPLNPPLRPRFLLKEDSSSKDNVILFWTTARDAFALLDPPSTALSPPLVGALGWAGGGTAVRIALKLLALSRTLSPSAFLSTLRSASFYRRTVACWIDSIILLTLSKWPPVGKGNGALLRAAPAAALIPSVLLTLRQTLAPLSSRQALTTAGGVVALGQGRVLGA